MKGSTQGLILGAVFLVSAFSFLLIFPSAIKVAKSTQGFDDAVMSIDFNKGLFTSTEVSATYVDIFNLLFLVLLVASIVLIIKNRPRRKGR